MSDYFDASGNRVSQGGLARSADVNTLRDEVGTGFDLLPDEDELKEGKTTFGIDTGAANAYVVTLPYPPSIYTTGQAVSFAPLFGNTTASTIDLGPGPKAIKRSDGSDVAAGDILATDVLSFVYNGTYFSFTGSVPASAAAAASAVQAAASASAASTSETNAGNSASAASTSASNASTSETNAGNSASAAATSATEAAGAVFAAGRIIKDGTSLNWDDSQTFVTITETSHGRKVGDFVVFSYVSGAAQSWHDVWYQIDDVIDVNTYTLPVPPDSGGDSGVVALDYVTEFTKNISSISTLGTPNRFILTIDTDAPDTDYVVLANPIYNGGTTAISIFPSDIAVGSFSLAMTALNSVNFKVSLG